MSFTIAIIIAGIVLYFGFFSNTINDSYLGRALIAIFIILITYCNTWLGVLAVAAAAKESFANPLFDKQNHLQKHVYYVPKRREAPIPQNDTNYVSLNHKAGDIQPSQPALVVKHANKKTTGNSYQHLLRVEEMVRPKSSKIMGLETGLNKDYEPKSNWPDGNAFKNPYSAAEN